MSETGLHSAYSRLDSLARSPEQDLVIRRLLDAGFIITTLDVARVKRVSIGESFRPGELHLIFRDKRDMRWVVDRSGRMSVSGRTSWGIVQ